jgi:hypothetical protein
MPRRAWVEVGNHQLSDIVLVLPYPDHVTLSANVGGPLWSTETPLDIGTTLKFSAVEK